MQRITRYRFLCVSLFLAVSISVVNAAPRPGSSPRSRRAAQTSSLGAVNFAISCDPAVQVTFNQALALLHSFQYQQAEQTFTQVAQQDPTCAMAYWGKAMSLYHQLWDWPSDATLKEGFQDTMQAQKLRAKTERERMYIVAAGVFFQDNPNLSKAARIKAYSDWMNRIFTKYPDDVDAGAFYALSLITLQGKGEDETANREAAIAILNKLFVVAPNHPGVAHYLIHAADTPELAPQGLDAARRYAKIAPDSSHALHMPSHIFVRLGLWQEAIQSNIAAAAAAAEATKAGNADPSYQFHAMDFLDYAYLQSGQSAKAEDVVSELKNVPGAVADEHVDVSVPRMLLKSESVAQNTAWLTARNAYELHQWKEAAALPVGEDNGALEITYFVKTVGAARMGDAAAAEQNFAKYKEAVASSQKQAAGYSVASSDTIGEQEAAGWVAFAEGKSAEALTAIRTAAAQEEKEGVDSLSTPAREMLGDMLLEMKRPADALAAYKTALAESPNRFNALYGAAQAAQLAGNATEARGYLAKLVKVCSPDADRPELQIAREEVAKK
ncbi:MAG TPA: tetratricopeptide repeat protein [Candidatus Acidoferrales bacterium]|nr:tetratricopeptide repeat protein [Candidatus Acidoferrales bacterium]